MGKRILLVEDDDSLNRAVSLKLSKEGYAVRSAFSLAEAKRSYMRETPDLIICDIGLPDGNGLDFCVWVRRQSDTLFLFLTALDTEIDMVNGYEAGADDYLTKPFSLMVLISKVNAIMKRRPRREAEKIISGNIRLYLAEQRAEKAGVPLNLTANELKLLTCFMQNPLRVLSKNQLLEAVWDMDGHFVDDNTVAVNIRRLREKIEEDPSHPKFIKNVRGLGYRWEKDCGK